MSFLQNRINQNFLKNSGFETWGSADQHVGVTTLDLPAAEWTWVQAGSMVVDIFKSTDVPTLAESGYVANYSFHVDVTTADAALTASDGVWIQQTMEGYTWQALAQKNFTFSFWVKATKIGTYSCSFRNIIGDRSWSSEYTVDVTDTWEYKTFTVDASPSAGTWDYEDGIGIHITWSLGSGSTWLNTAADTWETGNFIAGPNQVNAMDSAANNFRICMPKMEEGEVATQYTREGINFLHEQQLELGLTRQENFIHNGDFDVWQRGTSFTAATLFTADRWRPAIVGTTVMDIFRSTDVPTVAQSGHASNYSWHIDITTADTSIAAGDVVTLRQRIEGNDFRRFAQQPYVIHFWVKADKTGTYCVACRNSGADRTCVIEYTVDAADTWEYKVCKFPPTPSAGTWTYSEGIGLQVHWCLMSGTNFHESPAGDWVTGSGVATSNQVNGVDSAANDFRLSQVKLEVGHIPTPFTIAGDTAQGERTICERYYNKSYNEDVFPGASSQLGSMRESSSRTGGINHAARFPVRMRANPTIISYSTTGASGKARDIIAATDLTATVANQSNLSFYNSIAGATDNNSVAFQWTAEAEL